MLNKFMAPFLVLTAVTWVFDGTWAHADTPNPLINASLASQYVVTSMPLTKSPDCPLIGYLRFFPGGTLIGRFVTDMPRSKFIVFTGSYTLTGGNNIKFRSDDPKVPLSNINGTATRSVIVDKKKPPVEYLTITTATEKCANESYKLTLYVDEK